MSFLQNVHLAEWILNICVHSLFILLIGWLFVQVFKRKTAPLRSGISLITMLALVLLPFISISLSSLEYSTLPIGIFSSYPAENVGLNPITGIEKTQSIQKSIGLIQRIFGSGPFIIKFINTIIKKMLITFF